MSLSPWCENEKEIRAPNIAPAVVEYKLDNWATGHSALGINDLQSLVHIVLMAHTPSPKQDTRMYVPSLAQSSVFARKIRM